MNNFSPSTDTSVGTKRFTAQEVQLAYTLMAVEYMKTIKGLNPNHQLVDKAVKLKALGFTNSKEVGDAITSEEDLKVLKCYSFLQRHFPGSLILKEEDFINLNVKYGLVVGRLSAYKGSVPDENIDEISKVMATAQALEANEYVNYSGNGSPLRYVTGMQVATHPMPIDSMSYPVGRYFIRQEPSHIGLMYLSRNKARMNAYPFFHILNKAKAHDVNIADSKECSSADLFIAAPIEEMNETMQFTVPERKIIPINNDPFVFQVTPIGVMIHSKWGVEDVRQFVYDKPVKHKENVMVAEITYSKSKGIQIRELIPSTSHSSVSLWNIDTNKFHKVNVMMLSPNYWDEQGIGNKHYFFMLDDCKNPEPVRGFFNEYLNSELTPHRKVFEVLADKMKTPYQEHQLSGLGFSSTMRNSVIVKVDGTFSRTLKVNF